MYHYFMFHKPFGCVSARRDDRFPTVMDYFKDVNIPDLSPVGRLDRETEGLLFITNDGIWHQEMIHPSHKVPKTYEFLAMGILTEEKIQTLEQGIFLRGSERITAPAKIKVTGTSVLGDVISTLHPDIQEKTKHNRMDHPIVTGEITITEGKKRQIRRMMKSAGCLVLYLKRLSLGEYQLDPGLKPGEWKEIKIVK